MTQGFLSSQYDQVVVLYTDFRSMLTQEVRVLQLLPLKGDVESQIEDNRTFLYEPNPLQALNAVLPRLLEAELYQCLQESLASEHAARRVAMKSASDNASDMIDDLNLTYNGIRQSSITRELAEITSGAAALEG
jgi:F-type H+-transporting ATPase subunit gamma